MIEVGNLFFAKKDYEYALSSYRKVIDSKKAPEIWLAYQKAGLCLIQLDRWLEAVRSFESIYKAPNSIAETATDPQREEALVSSVWPLLELSPQDLVQQPRYQKPVAYYREAAGDQARFRRVLARLAQRAQLKKRTADHIEASLELFKLADDFEEKRSAFEAYYLQAKSQKSFHPDFWVVAELRSVVLSLKKHSNKAEQKKLFDKYEIIFRDVLTTIQKNVVMTKRTEDLARLGEFYGDYLEIYPKTKFHSSMKLNQAEVYFLAAEYSRAGQAYFELALVKSDKQKEFWLSSLESFLKVIVAPSDALLDKVQSRAGYRQVAATYLRAFPRDAKRPGIEFNVARTYYDEQSFEKAAPLFRAYLQKYPQSENSKMAALLYLDCFYLRAQLPEMAKAGTSLLRISGLSEETKNAIREASNQAQMKALRSVAGELTSPNYAVKFREFARKTKIPKWANKLCMKLTRLLVRKIKSSLLNLVKSMWLLTGKLRGFVKFF